MIDLKQNSNKILAKLLHESDDVNVLEEIARRINLGLIPLAMINFSRLSNRKLQRLDNLTFENCDWALKEIYKRIKEGKIPEGKPVTMEEVGEMYCNARQATI